MDLAITKAILSENQELISIYAGPSLVKNVQPHTTTITQEIMTEVSAEGAKYQIYLDYKKRER